MIELMRDYHDDRTLGYMTLESGTRLATIERPWLNNQPMVSCIPEGVYKLHLRDSSVVNRTTRGAYLQGWEVTGVPNRSFIMLHIANFPHDVEGCIGVGLKQGSLAGELAILQSAPAFNVLMNELAGHAEWYLDIKKRVA